MPIATGPDDNRLLAALPVNVKAALLPALELVSLPAGQLLNDTGRPLSHAYFPLSSIISKVSMTETGNTIGVSLVGNEGMIGVSICMTADSRTTRAIVQSSGHAYRMSANSIKSEFARYGPFMVSMLHYAQARMSQVAQLAACNRFHVTEQRFAQLLLMYLDRLPGTDLPLTHQLTGELLGVRRESVTTAAQHLQRLGVIACSRGHIRVLDRDELEKHTCECYRVVRNETDRLTMLNTLPSQHDTMPGRMRRWPESSRG